MSALPVGLHLDALLAGAHHCDPGCPHCVALLELEDEHRPALLTGWDTFVRSDQAIRFALNEVEFGIPFPDVSHDDLVNYVIRESVLHRFHEERAAELELEERRSSARAESQRRLRENVGAGGVAR